MTGSMRKIIAGILLLLTASAIASTPVLQIFPTPSASPGGVAYFPSNSSMASTAAGSSGQCLISNGTAAPTFGSCASGTLTANTLANGATINGLNAILFPTQDTTPGQSIGIGANALSGLTGSFAYMDTAVGYNTLTGAGTVNNLENTAVGSFALQQCCTGVAHANVAVGAQALTANTTGDGDIGIGFRSLFVLTSGNHNIVVGNQGLSALTTGSFNTAMGRQVGILATTASNNTALGYQVGSVNLTTGNNNILIGTDSSTDLPGAGFSNSLNLGNAILATNLQNLANTGGVPVLTLTGSVQLTPANTINFANAATAGLAMVVNTATFNDTSGNATPLNYTAVSVAAPTYTSNIAATVTNAVTMRLAAPVCGTNVTCTNKYALVAAAGINVTTGAVSAPDFQKSGVSIVPLAATSASIGGSALAAGACTSGTVAVAGSTTGMAVVATPVTYPGDGSTWAGYVSAAGTVTVKVCAIAAVTPGASTYNVRVLQ